jgi:hypothetical protein
MPRLRRPRSFATFGAVPSDNVAFPARDCIAELLRGEVDVSGDLARGIRLIEQVNCQMQVLQCGFECPIATTHWIFHADHPMLILHRDMNYR